MKNVTRHAEILPRRSPIFFLPAIAFAVLLALPNSRAGEEDIAFFEKTYKTKITGVRPIKEYPDPAQFYSAIAEQLGIPEKASAAAKANGWEEATEKIQKTDIKRLSAPPRWQVTLLQIKLDRETNRVDPESTELTRFELDDEGKAHHIELPNQEAERLKAKEQKTFDGVLSMMLKVQRLIDENPDQDPLELALELGEKFSELLVPAEAEVLQELMLEAPLPVDKVPSPPVAIAPSGLTLVVCDSSNKVLDTIVIPRAQRSIKYRISVPKDMVEVRAFAIGKGRTLEWLREDLTENYCEARTDDKGSNDWGRMDATVEDYTFTGFSGIAGMKPLKVTDEMRDQIKKDIAEDKRSPLITIISKGKQGGDDKTDPNLDSEKTEEAKPDESPKKGADLQGTWQGVEVWDAGEKRTAEPAKLLQIKFRGDQFVVRYDGEKMLSGRFSVDDRKTPKMLTLEAVAQDRETSTIPAVYKIENDKLSLCHPNKEGGDRPSAFNPSEEVVLAVLTKQE